MNDDPNKQIDNRILVDAVEEIKEMGKEGMHHPSTKPVLIGAAAGAVAGWILPLVGPILGGLAGAGMVLYKRVRP